MKPEPHQTFSLELTCASHWYQYDLLIDFQVFVDGETEKQKMNKRDKETAEMRTWAKNWFSPFYLYTWDGWLSVLTSKLSMNQLVSDGTSKSFWFLIITLLICISRWRKRIRSKQESKKAGSQKAKSCVPSSDCAMLSRLVGWLACQNEKKHDRQEAQEMRERERGSMFQISSSHELLKV